MNLFALVNAAQVTVRKLFIYKINYQLFLGAGFVNVLRLKGAKATASSNSDKAHEPSKGIDGTNKLFLNVFVNCGHVPFTLTQIVGNLRTWWGSGAFPDAGEHRVVYDMDIGKMQALSRRFILH